MTSNPDKKRPRPIVVGVRPCRACKRVREWAESAPFRDKAAKQRRIQAILDCPRYEGGNWVIGVEPLQRCDHKAVS